MQGTVFRSRSIELCLARSVALGLTILFRPPGLVHYCHTNQKDLAQINKHKVLTLLEE